MDSGLQDRELKEYVRNVIGLSTCLSPYIEITCIHTHFIPYSWGFLLGSLSESL